MAEAISSEQNSRFQLWRRVASSARDRRQTGLIWLEGQRLVDEGLDALARQPQRVPESALLVRAGGPNSGQALQGRLAGLQLDPLSVFALDERLWGRISQVEQPQGIALVMPRPEPTQTLAAQLAQDAPWSDWVVLDGLQDPGNVGSLLRAAAASGVSRIVLLRGTAEAFSPKALRAGMGAQFRLQIWEGLSREDWIEQSISQGVLNLLTLAPQAGRTRSIWAIPELAVANRLAWIMGQEGDGLHPDWVSQSEALRLTIPQSAGLESLNVTTAAAVCLFERARLRSLAQETPQP